MTDAPPMTPYEINYHHIVCDSCSLSVKIAPADDSSGDGYTARCSSDCEEIELEALVEGGDVPESWRWS